MSRSTDNFHYDGDDLESLAGLPNYHDWVVSLAAPFLKGRILEIGAGIGTISKRLRPMAEHLDLVEPSAGQAEALTAMFAEQGDVTIHGALFETYIETIPDNTFDAVVMVNVLEHIEDDAAALAAIVRVLKPGGTFFVFVPALRQLFSAMDVKLGHYRRYHKPELTRLVADAGLQIVDARYFDILGVLPWWLINTLGGTTDFNPAMVRLYDRVGVPVTKLVEGIVSPPLGKNVYVLARKDG